MSQKDDNNNIIDGPNCQMIDTNSVVVETRATPAPATLMICSQTPTTNTTYPRLGPLGTRNGATMPTSPHSVVKQIIGRARE